MNKADGRLSIMVVTLNAAMAGVVTLEPAINEATIDLCVAVSA